MIRNQHISFCTLSYMPRVADGGGGGEGEAGERGSNSGYSIILHWPQDCFNLNIQGGKLHRDHMLIMVNIYGNVSKAKKSRVR